MTRRIKSRPREHLKASHALIPASIGTFRTMVGSVGKHRTDRDARLSRCAESSPRSSLVRRRHRQVLDPRSLACAEVRRDRGRPWHQFEQIIRDCVPEAKWPAPPRCCARNPECSASRCPDLSDTLARSAARSSAPPAHAGTARERTAQHGPASLEARRSRGPRGRPPARPIHHLGNHPDRRPNPDVARESAARRQRLRSRRSSIRSDPVRCAPQHRSQPTRNVRSARRSGLTSTCENSIACNNLPT